MSEFPLSLKLMKPPKPEKPLSPNSLCQLFSVLLIQWLIRCFMLFLLFFFLILTSNLKLLPLFNFLPIYIWPLEEKQALLQIRGSVFFHLISATVASLSLFTFMHWRRQWQSTPIFLPGESQGQRSLVGCRLWGRTELDTTEVT